MTSIPFALTSTLELLKRAYPNDDFDKDYYCIIKILYDEFSDRNLTIVISEFTNKPSYEVANDIYVAVQMNIDCTAVINKLKDNGYDDWLNEKLNY